MGKRWAALFVLYILRNDKEKAKAYESPKKATASLKHVSRNGGSTDKGFGTWMGQ